MKESSFLHIYFPYVLVKVSAGKWVALNRNLQPLSNSQLKLKLSDAEATKLSASQAVDDYGQLAKVWLYADNETASEKFWESYSERLEALAKSKLGL